MDRISEFVERLGRAEVGESACNQYAFCEPANCTRRGNLELYLREMSARGPGVMLVGEAPGYKGCRLTGVPFTSETILLAGVEGLRFLGRERGYRVRGGEHRL